MTAMALGLDREEPIFDDDPLPVRVAVREGRHIFAWQDFAKTQYANETIHEKDLADLEKGPFITLFAWVSFFWILLTEFIRERKYRKMHPALMASSIMARAGQKAEAMGLVSDSYLDACCNVETEWRGEIRGEEVCARSEPDGGINIYRKSEADYLGHYIGF